MIRLIRPFFYPVLFLAALTCGGDPSFAGPGGSGVRNGGSGIRCTTMSTPAPIAYERFSTISIAGLGPEQMKLAALERLRQVDSTFADAVAVRLALHGPAREWKTWSETSTSLSGAAREFSDALAWVVKRFNAELVRPWGGSVLDVAAHLHLTYDEQLDQILPPGCRLVQLAIFDGAEVYQISGALQGMAEVDLAVLELHEAIYAVGFLQYGHSSSLLTRRLLTEAISLAFRASRLAEFFADFVRFPEARLAFQSASPLHALEGIYVHTGDPRVESPRCPIAIRLLFDGSKGLTFDQFFVYRSYSDPSQSPWVVVKSGRTDRELGQDRCKMKRWEEVRDAI